MPRAYAMAKMASRNNKIPLFSFIWTFRATFGMFTVCMNDENIKIRSTINKPNVSRERNEHEKNILNSKWNEEQKKSNTFVVNSNSRHFRWTILIKWNIHLIIFRDVQQIFQQAPVVTVTTATTIKNKMLTWLIWCESLKFVSMWGRCLYLFCCCCWCCRSFRAIFWRWRTTDRKALCTQMFN